MGALRSVFLSLTVLFIASSSLSPAAWAQRSDEASNTVAVGLLSIRDRQPVARVGPCRAGDSLSATLEAIDGTVSRRILNGDVFLALDQGRSAAGQPAAEQRVGAGEKNPFSVQTGSYVGKEAAERFAAEIRGRWPEKEIWVMEARLGDGTAAHRVMAGRFPDRDLAQAFTLSLAAYGIDGAFVVQTGQNSTAEEGSVAGEGTLVLYSRGTGLIKDLERVTFSAVPPVQNDGGETLPAFMLDGASYRGVLELRGGGAGIIAVNRVPLEEYLLGVVPCELGPDRFPLLEALKAQAVAARTYALKHVGRHRGEGFDLCDTPHCQVYGGAGREKPLSSEAVRQTWGLAAFYQGNLAETLYTSTCGGRTECSSAVFSGPAESYLGGVPCTADHRAVTLSIPLPLVRIEPKVTEAESGADLGFALGLLTHLGLLHSGEITPPSASRAVSRAEADQWIRRFCSRYPPAEPLPVAGVEGEPDRPLSRCELALGICEALGWDQRLATLFTAADIEEIVGGAGEGGERCGGALALLLSTGIFKLLPDGRPAGEESASRGRFAAALARLAVHLEPELFEEGVLAGAGEGALRLRFGADEVGEHGIVPRGLMLFERREESTRPVPLGRFHVGDRVLVHFDQGGRVDILIRLPAAGGAAADRYSPYALWSIVVDRETIEGLLEGNGHHIGQLIDLQPLQRGSSGRLTRLRVIGTSGEALLQGLDIRWNLGTRENLFFIDRLKSVAGLNSGYRFTGRGWGHGVGMCQVGAAGLAETGASFIEILQHYYPGIRIEPAAGIPSRP
jgi:stage II sporulation protein D